MVFSALSGKTFTGDEFVPVGDEPTAQAIAQWVRDTGGSEKVAQRVAKTGEIAMRELAPLVVQQTIEGIQVDGPMGGLLTGAGEFVGIGASAFEPRRKSTRAKRSKRRTR